MGVLMKIVVSVLALLVGAMFIYPTAYAFGVDSTLRGWLNYLQLGLTLASIVAFWTPRPSLGGAGMALVILITGLILMLNARARPPAETPPTAGEPDVK